jgi:uncharacterized protein YfaS (alpha-2-macroglobulin family)
VLAPYLIRPGRPYNVAIRRWGITKAINITLSISGKKDSGLTINPITSTFTISTLTSGSFVSLNIASLTKGTYFLTVSGEGYTDRRALTFATKTSALLLQVNKSFFSPEQTVQFRLYAYNSETNAVTPSGNCTITVSDPRGSVIATYNQITFVKGKYQNEFELASNPPFGYWYLNAQCGNDVSFNI